MALINLRNALMSGKRLPYDAEVEFLESTGTQWIDTGIIPDTQDIRVDITYANGKGHLFGSRISSSFGASTWSAYAATANYCRKDWLASNTSISVAATAKTIVFSSDSTGSSITYNGMTETAGVKTTNNLSMVIFGVNTNGTITAAMQMTLYSFKIWKNNVLVRDFIPVRKGTTGYLYDRVSKRLFGNAGTGDFVLGPDVVPVEYLQGNKSSSTSGPWIDTGTNPSICNDSILECKVAFELLPYTLDQYTGIFGAAVPRFGAYAINDKLSFGYSSAYDNIVTISRNQVYNLDFESTKGAQSAYLNGENIWTGTNSSTLSNSYSIGLFCRNAATPAWQNNLRIYNCEFNIDGTPTRKYRPVRVGTDATSWEGAMMDVLTRRVYRNAGTGAFTYGNDLKYPIPAS